MAESDYYGLLHELEPLPDGTWALAFEVGSKAAMDAMIAMASSIEGGEAGEWDIPDGRIMHLVLSEADLLTRFGVESVAHIDTGDWYQMSEEDLKGALFEDDMDDGNTGVVDEGSKEPMGDDSDADADVMEMNEGEEDEAFDDGNGMKKRKRKQHESSTKDTPVQPPSSSVVAGGVINPSQFHFCVRFDPQLGGTAVRISPLDVPGVDPASRADPLAAMFGLYFVSDGYYESAQSVEQVRAVLLNAGVVENTQLCG